MRKEALKKEKLLKEIETLRKRVAELEKAEIESKRMEEELRDSKERHITERKRMEEKIKEYSEDLERLVAEKTKDLNQALLESKEVRDKIDGILKSVVAGLIVTDMHKRIILMNSAVVALLGVNMSEVINQPIDFAFKDETLRERFKTILEKKESGYQFEFELPGEDPELPRFMRGITSMIKDKTGATTGIVTLMHDVTYEREVDRMKTEFITAAAHELKTPITSIRGFSEILLTRGDIKEEEKEKFLSYINQQSVNLTAMINNLFTISRVESGKRIILNRVPCDISEIIMTAVSQFQDLSPKHNFEVVLPEESMELMVDKEKIRQVLEHILSNEVKFSPKGGPIRINGEILNKQYRIAVEDQGIGMSQKQVKKIFDKYYRADPSNTALEGAGLGMTIVKCFVEAHRGKIWVESKLGKGTAVTFTIPLE